MRAYQRTHNIVKNIYLQRYVTIKLGRYERNVIMLFGATYSLMIMGQYVR